MTTNVEDTGSTLRGLVINLEPCLTPEDVEYIWESIDAGEITIAFEDLCTQLEERDAEIDLSAYRDLQLIGEQLGVSPDYWETFRPDATVSR